MVVAALAEPATRVLTLTGPGGCGRPVSPPRRQSRSNRTIRTACISSGWARSATRPRCGRRSVMRSTSAAPLTATSLRWSRHNFATVGLAGPGQSRADRDAESVVQRLRSVAPGVDMLASSRRPLLLVGAREFPVAPLAVPESGEVDAVRRSPAAVVFADQARLARPSFEITADNAAAVAAVCRRLDGLPLALELAAAQTRLLSASALLAPDRRTPRRHVRRRRPPGSPAHAARDDRLELRPARARGAGAVPPVGRVPRRRRPRRDHRLAAAGRRRRAARAGGRQHGPGRRDAEGEPRIDLLQTIRAFAREQLAESGESEAVRDRHLHWCAEAVDAAVPLLRGSSAHRRVGRLHALDDDIRAALEFAFDPAGAADVARRGTGRRLLITVTTRYWYLFGSVAEAGGGRNARWPRARRTTTTRTSACCSGSGFRCCSRACSSMRSGLLGRARDLAEHAGADDWQARTLNAMGVAQRQAGNVAESIQLLQRSLSLAQRAGNDELRAKALGNLVVLQHDSGDYGRRCARPRRPSRSTPHAATTGRSRSITSTTSPRCCTRRAQPLRPGVTRSGCPRC